MAEAADTENSPVLGTSEKKELQWSTAKVKDALAWHTPTDPTARKGLGTKTSRSSNDLPGIVAQTSEAIPHVVSETDLAARSETNVFRLSDANINRAFSSTTQKASSPVGRKALDALERDDSSADSHAAEQRSLSAERQQLRRNVSTETSTFADYVISRAGKLVVAMVGLPARGKSFIAMSIKRHLDWLGLETRIFNAGNYRRELAQGEEQGSAFFDPTNKDGAEIRRRCAEAALRDALSCLTDPAGNVCVAIFDATNTTFDRRRWLKEEVAAAAEQLASSSSSSSSTSSGSGTAVAGSDSDDGVIAAPAAAAAAAAAAKCCGLKLAFAETVLTSDEQVWENVKDAKLKSPDYVNMDPDDAMKDFLARIAAYKKVYEPLQKEEGVSFIRLTNAGEELLTYQCSGYTLGRISWLMGSMRLTPRPILLTRSGESCNDTEGRMGGDTPLTAIGSLFAQKLQATMHQWQKHNSNIEQAGAVVWTSTRLRAMQTAKGLGRSFPVLQVPMLDELKFGVADSLTHAEFAEAYPEVAAEREQDKLNVRFPGGESYLDLFKRLEPLLLELVAETQPVVIISHLGVLRVIYGYLMGIEPARCPYLELPMNAVVQLNPKGYGYEEWRHFPT